MIKSIDLFSGAGGLSIGLRDSGFESVMAVEIEQDAAITYRDQIPEAKVQCEDIDYIDFSIFSGSIDIIAGGPPCQPFSSGGQRDAQNDSRDMVPAFMYAVEIVQPRAVLMENVPGLAVGDRKGYFQSVLDHLKSLGYYVSWKVLNAARYGVPQIRQRLFIVGLKERPFLFPKETHGPGTSRPFVTVNDVLPPHQIGEPNESKIFYAKTPDLRPNPYHGQLFNGGGRPIDRTQPAPTILASAGGNKTHFFDDLNLVPQYHSHLLKGGEPYTGFLPGARRLTVLESAVLQTFPQEMIFHGSRSSQYKQIGNAVPPLLARVIGNAIIKQLVENGEVSYYFTQSSIPTQQELFPKEATTFMAKITRNDAVERAVNKAIARIDDYLGGEEVKLPAAKYRRAIDDVLTRRKANVRTALLFLMFYRLEDSSWDLSSVPVGARGKFGDKRLGEALNNRSLSLNSNTRAWGENLGSKGNVRNFEFLPDPRFKDFLEMVKDATVEEQISIANYFAYRFADSRKESTPLPLLSEDKLTFSRTKALFHDLLKLQTEGHVQQFLIASLLKVFRVKQSIEVKTHHPHASDEFDKTAGDIEEFAQKKRVRAYEVTMRNDWQNRISGFTQKMERFGLDKYVIIASNINNSEWAEPAKVALSLNKYGRDIAVIDILDVVHFFAAELSAEELRSAINNTYAYLRDPKLSNRQEFIEQFRFVVEKWLDEVSEQL